MLSAFNGESTIIGEHLTAINHDEVKNEFRDIIFSQHHYQAMPSVFGMVPFVGLFIGFLLSFSSLSAQQITIKGIVLDSIKRTPVPLAEILLTTNHTGTVSDTSGRFFLQIHKRTFIQMRISHVGYQHKILNFPCCESDTSIKVFLLPKTPFLKEVVIWGDRNDTKDLSIVQIHAETLKSTRFADVGTLLRNASNVSGIRKGTAGIDPVIRGFKYAQLNVQVNGASIEGGCPNRMDPPTAHLDLNAISSIKILKGPFALKYGTNFGGVLLISRFQPHFYNHFENHIQLSMGGQTNQGGNKSGVRIFGGNKKCYYELSGNRLEYGDYQSGNGTIIAGALHRTGFAASTSIKVAKNHIMGFSTDISQGKNIDFPALSMDERLDNTRLFNFNYDAKKLAGIVNKLHLNVYQSLVHHEMDNKERPFSDTVVAVSVIDAVNTGFKFSSTFNVLKGTLDLGTDFYYITKNGQRDKYLILQPNLPVKKENLWHSAFVKNLGFYAVYSRNINAFYWTAAFRLDCNKAGSLALQKTLAGGEYRNDITGSTYYNGSFSSRITWQIDEKSAVSLSIGSGTRSPDLTERFIILLPIGMDPYDYLGNPQLKPETNNEMDLNYRINFRQAGTIKASVFYSYVTNYISAKTVSPSVIRPATPGVLGVKQFGNIPYAQLKGFELSWYSSVNKLWQMILNASYTMGTNPVTLKPVMVNGQVVDELTIYNDPLPEIPPFEMDIHFKYSFFAHKLVPKAMLRLVAAQNRVSQAFLEKTTPGFTVADAGLKYHYNSHFTIYAGIHNLFNKNYYEHLNRISVKNSTPLYEPGRIFYMNLNLSF